MPNYLYKCEGAHTLEVTHSIKENPEVLCPVCLGAMRRVPYPITPTFSGSGFYSTDKNNA